MTCVPVSFGRIFTEHTKAHLIKKILEEEFCFAVCSWELGRECGKIMHELLITDNEGIEI